MRRSGCCEGKYRCGNWGFERRRILGIRGFCVCEDLREDRSGVQEKGFFCRDMSLNGGMDTKLTVEIFSKSYLIAKQQG